MQYVVGSTSEGMCAHNGPQQGRLAHTSVSRHAEQTMASTISCTKAMADEQHIQSSGQTRRHMEWMSLHMLVAILLVPDNNQLVHVHVCTVHCFLQ